MDKRCIYSEANWAWHVPQPVVGCYVAKCNNFFKAKCNTSRYEKSKYLFKSLSYKGTRRVYLKCIQAGLVLRAGGLAIR